MAYVVTRLCRDCLDLSCARECPVDCILEHRPAPGEPALPRQLYIDPAECIDCGVCEPVCPWEAIRHEDDVPAIFEEDVKLNALVLDHPDRFHPPDTDEEKPLPMPTQVEANKKRWGPNRE